MNQGKYIITTLFTFMMISTSFAVELPGPSITITTTTSISKSQAVTLGDLMTTYFTTVGSRLPESYTDIQLKFTNIPKTPGLHQALQKGVMMGLIKNVPISLHFLSTKVNEDAFKMLAKKRSQIDLPIIQGERLSAQRLTELDDHLPDYFTQTTAQNTDSTSLSQIKNFAILEDVYQKLKNQHIQGSTFNDEKLIQGAIQGMTRATEDEHTTYFPPAEAQEFSDELN
jgi:hypothetical protein